MTTSEPPPTTSPADDCGAAPFPENSSAPLSASGHAPWHALDAPQTLANLNSSPNGLAESEAAARLGKDGPNELIESGLKSPWLILWEQFTAPLMLILIGAAALAVAIKGPRDAIAIMAIVVLNALLGFYQEYRAERAMAALKKMAAPRVRVRREGRVLEVAGRELVRGDIVLLEAGNAVPADLRVLESANLRAQEASLTGESLPVDKQLAPVAEDASLGDRKSCLFLGTSITYGRGEAVVVETGMHTELGRIATLLQDVESHQTPLQKRIAKLGIAIGAAIGVVVALMFLIGVLRGGSVLEMLMAAIAVAVAAIPEGLPAVMTITLALGAQRMLKRRALIRKLPAVETLGSVTTICSDKTGTLTENKMTVVMLDVAGHETKLHQQTHEGQPVLEAQNEAKTPSHAGIVLLSKANALCNDAIFDMQDDGSRRTLGDPTEGALLVAAEEFGLFKSRLDGLYPRVSEVPFSSERKRMTTIHRLRDSDLNTDLPPSFWLPHLVGGSDYVAFTKGSPDGMLDVCDRVWVDGEALPLDESWRTRIENANAQMASQGLRVLGTAFKPLGEIPENADESLENGLIFVGLTGMIDPPRAEVKDAVRSCKEAGIRPVMITGDHPLTAAQIARELGIDAQGRVLIGSQLEAMSDEELEAEVENVAVYARVSPEHKLRIVEALQKKGHVVAMTGDGVNDAPALRRADIGVAMGITGTDVSKEAAHMVITDDNFTTIVSAVEEGRTIYDNVRRFVKYILTSNTGEVSVMFATQAMGMPLPLNTLQILWMNLVTDGVPGLALGLEPTEKDAMRRKPYAPNESIFSRGIGWHVLTIGPLLGAVALAVGVWAYYFHSNPAVWGTMVFTTLTLSQLGHALAVRSHRESIFKIGLFSNKPLVIAVLVTFLLQMALIYLPPLQAFFETQPLSALELGIALGAATIVFWAVELEKWVIRRKEAATQNRREVAL